ncbi:hypothetical protein HDU85_000440 [Gaertneriomyces sp. JEL0708]|nr:hypothetical protein HDU85_000440 [Gaertneriomyces sp. JEL0708]
MLPSIVPPLPKPDTQLAFAPPPPQPTDEQLLKGGHALRKLQRYCEELFQVQEAHRKEIGALNATLRTVNSQKGSLEAELRAKNDKIAAILHLEHKEYRFSRTQEETETLLHEEIRRRHKSEAQVVELQGVIKTLEADHAEYRRVVELEAARKEDQSKLIEQLKQTITNLERNIRELEFNIDQEKVQKVKFQRSATDLEKALDDVTRKYDRLLISENALREENGQLQKRVQDLMAANKEVTLNYQAVKRNQDTKREEYEALVRELDEAKGACHVVLKQRKQLQTELAGVIKQRNEITERHKAMETLLSRKEKDIADLLTKVNDTINEYELKLEKKEEQMWAMSVQMTEAAQSMQKAPAPPPPEPVSSTTIRNMNARMSRVVADIDPEFIDNMEKKWQAKEKALQTELDHVRTTLGTKERDLTLLRAAVADLTKKQFQPRMERLTAIEKDIKVRLEQYALSEERMETGFLCPRDVKFFRKPVTLIPCGHTYCSSCIDAVKEENYNSLKCQICPTPVEHVFRNEQLESVEEHFEKRRVLTTSFLEW